MQIRIGETTRQCQKNEDWEAVKIGQTWSLRRRDKDVSMASTGTPDMKMHAYFRQSVNIPRWLWWLIVAASLLTLTNKIVHLVAYLSIH